MKETRLEINIDSKGLEPEEIKELVWIALMLYAEKYNTQVDEDTKLIPCSVKIIN